MSDEAAPASETQITFTVKSSSDQKYSVTVPETMTVLDLKHKLSAEEYANVSAERQRLIYSGRVLKDPDQLSVYKIKDGNTIHMVKGAASSSQQQQSSASSTAANASSGNSGAASNVPQNIAAGTGNDPLAGLTGARYAGFAQMPGASQFGPDGGMAGGMGNPDDLLRMLENPMFQSQMNEAMNNPQIIQMLQNNPMIRDQPFMREMLNNPEMRRMMMDPQFIRQSIQMSRLMGGMGGGPGQASSMPAPGVTDNTPQQDSGSTGTSTEQTSIQPQQQQQQQQQSSQNPLMGLFPFPNQQQGGATGAGTGAGAQANPFAALFGGMNPPATNPSNHPNTSTTSTSPTADTARDASQTTSNQQQQQQPQQPPTSPFPSIFGGPGPGSGDQQQQNNPFAAAAQQMMQNPEMMQNMMRMMGGGGAGGAGPGGAEGAGAGGFNLFPGLAGMGSPPPQQQDTRPPEEQYAEQLRSLNEMGFYDFESNVRALRRSGGDVQGAVAALLGDM